jgi:hypothetical protein
MIRFRFGIANPFKYKEFRNIWSWDWSVTKNKTLELEFYRYAYEVVSCDLDLSFRGQSHAGPNFELNVLGWNFRIALSDNRHWDYEHHRWEKFFD